MTSVYVFCQYGSIVFSTLLSIYVYIPFCVCLFVSVAVAVAVAVALSAGSNHCSVRTTA